MENSYLFLQVFFGLITLLSIVLFIKASTNHKTTLGIVLFSWMIVQGIVSYTGFYEFEKSMPPRFVLLIGPPLLTIVFLAATKKGRLFIHQLNPVTLTMLHTVRVAVEFGLLWLFVFGLIPEVMTFEGRNFDVISGATAPFIAWGMRHGKFPKYMLIAWNFICLGLVLNVVLHGVLSVDTPFKQLTFEVPTKGVLLFPFTWLPGIIVPLVIFSHVACLVKLFAKRAV